MTTYHGVLSHEDDGLSTKGDTDLMHLLRRDIVDIDDEDLAVLLEKLLELLEVSDLVIRLSPHIFCETIGYLR